MSALTAAFRQLRQHPGFTLITVLVLGLGTGAATAVFTVVDAVVLRPLPYQEPDRLVTIWDTNAGQALSHDRISPVNFMDQRALPVFEDAAAWWRPGINLTEPGRDPMRVNTIEAGGNLFAVLGINPQLGDGFPRGGPLFARGELLAVISDRLWRERFNSDRGIIGRPIVLNGSPYIVAGVMPAGFHFPDDVDVWQRLQWDMTQHSRQAHFMEAVARLQPDATIEQAQSAVDALWVRFEQEFGQTRNTPGKGWGSRLVPLLDERLGYYRPALIVLFGAVGLLLAIAILNVASLLLTRALAREREIAVRVALGASPSQLVKQLMSESLVLSAAGAAVGLMAAMAALPLILKLMPLEIPRLQEASVDTRALALGLLLVGLTTVFFGLVPAVLLLKRQVSVDLKSGERGSSRGARRLYSVLVTAEVALACALLVSSALLVRTVQHMMRTPLGVSADDVLVTTVQLTVPPVPRGTSFVDVWRPIAETHTQIVEAIRRQPGVVAAGASNFLPLEIGWRQPFVLDGQPWPTPIDDAPQAQMQSVSEGYLETMGASLLEGRLFTPFDNRDTAGVIVVNETFARRHLPAGRAVGTVVRLHSSSIGPLGVNLKASNTHEPAGQAFEVIGVVRDIRNVPLGQRTEPAFFTTTRQYPFSEVYLAVRATDAATALTAVREGLRAVAPQVPMAAARTWGDRFATRTAEPRLLMVLLLFFGGVAAALAALGVYGLFSWAVAQRTRELAIRLTLGARPARVGGSVLAQSAVLIGAGLVVGLIVVRLSEAALTRVLYEVSPSDSGSILMAAAVLVTAAIVACLPPALRAMHVNPADGLRVE
jgi:putative ABC transport system permease protein